MRRIMMMELRASVRFCVCILVVYCVVDGGSEFDNPCVCLSMA